jgi:hypothetical protein
MNAALPTLKSVRQRRAHANLEHDFDGDALDFRGELTGEWARTLGGFTASHRVRVVATDTSGDDDTIVFTVDVTYESVYELGAPGMGDNLIDGYVDAGEAAVLPYIAASIADLASRAGLPQVLLPVPFRLPTVDPAEPTVQR